MGIFDFFKKKQPEIKDHLDRLTPEGDIPYGWAAANWEFINKTSDEYSHFFGIWYEARDKAPKEKYAALKSYVTYMKDLKRICAAKGECFALYCSDLWVNDKALEGYERELQYIKDNFADLEDMYQREQYIKHCVLPQLPDLINEKPGILQTEIYKMFPVDCKDHISYELYKLSWDGEIRREKSGRTYSLYIK